MKKNIVINTLVVGFIAGVIFILVQPLFGMETLTSRHAAAYINLGGYSEAASHALAWFVHSSVSIFYALLAAVIFNFNHSLLVSFVQVVVLGWLTTLMATPANEWVVKVVTTKQFPALDSLSALNTQVGPKLWLHMLFFVIVLCGLNLIRTMTLKKFSNEK